MLEIILLAVLVLVVLVVSIMTLGVLIAYATQTAYDMEKDINDD
jgi:uncharacterized membrane protein YqjE